MNKELHVLQRLGEYEEMCDADKFMLNLDLEAMSIPSDRIDMECSEVRDLVGKVVLGMFQGDTSEEAVQDLTDLWFLSQEPRIKMQGGHQISLGVGEDVLTLSLRTYKQLKEMLNSIDDTTLRKELNGDRWRTKKNLDAEKFKDSAELITSETERQASLAGAQTKSDIK